MVSYAVPMRRPRATRDEPAQDGVPARVLGVSAHRGARVQRVADPRIAGMRVALRPTRRPRRARTHRCAVPAVKSLFLCECLTREHGFGVHAATA